MLVNIALAALITAGLYGVVLALTHEWGKPRNNDKGSAGRCDGADQRNSL